MRKFCDKIKFSIKDFCIVVVAGASVVVAPNEIK
jgi:hypothetical protein